MSQLMTRLAAQFLAIPLEERATRLFEMSSTMPMRFIRATPERPYMERYFLANIDGEYAYLHRFVNGDGDRYVHSHPWDLATSLILAGSYEEVRRDLKGQESTFKRCPGEFNTITASTLHRIMFTQPETWTLFVHTEWVRDWGFERDNGEMVRNQSDPDGTNRFWWTWPSSLELHRDRYPFLETALA